MSATRIAWTPELKRIYGRYPAAIRSNSWPDIVTAANAGDVARAMELGRANEGQSKSIRAENVIARRIRVQRIALFNLQRDGETIIRAIFKRLGDDLAGVILPVADDGLSAIPRMKRPIKAIFAEFRRSLNKEITDQIWEAIALGIKNMGEALKPIIRANRESFHVEQSLLEEMERPLSEDRLTLDLSHRIYSRNATVSTGSSKWASVMDRIYGRIVHSNNRGLKPSERIWDFASRAEAGVKRILVSEIANGTNARQIAGDIQQFVFTPGVDDNVDSGPGIYRSPFKNAMRLARTETTVAYTHAAASWAESKTWIEGLRVTLSPAHTEEDDCDDFAGEIYSPSEFADLIPLHPHCMCFPTYVIKDEYLADGEGDNSGDGAAPLDD